MNVPLLDLRAQYGTLRDDLDSAVSRVIESQYFILGPEVEALEAEMAEYLGTAHAVGCASGTDALLLPLRSLEPEPGDEVILPAFTFFATAGAVWNAGFTPVFCDIDPVTFNVTAESMDAVWSDRTRAVIPVHLFGQMAPMDSILELARERDAFVLEDAAQAIGARQLKPGNEEVWAMAGSRGDAGAFSFFPTKNLGGFGDGGLVTTDSGVVAERVAKLRVHGGRQMYHHEMVGTNSRLDALQAAVLRVKLPHLDRWVRARGEHACYYHGRFADLSEVTLPGTAPGNAHAFNQYTVRVARRDELREHLSGKGIGTGVYYPVPLHLQECFSSLGGRPGQLPESERACLEVLSLPVYPELGEGQLDRVVTEVRGFFGA